MRLAIMQPYFLPYLGYFQLIGAVDRFVLYDNIKYTKTGWINRNRMLQNGQDATFSIPLKGASDFLNVCERELAADFNRDKLLNRFKGAYLRAPYFDQTYPLIEEVVRYEDRNLFRFLHHSIQKVCAHLDLTTEIVVSSSVEIDHALKNQDKVLALCAALGASTYLNAIGGTDLYSKERFMEQGVELRFLRSKPFEYRQFGDVFVPSLSIVDAMMFNAKDTIQNCLATHYELI